MDWKDKMRFIVADVLNKPDNATCFEVTFVDDNHFKIEEVSAWLPIRHLTYGCVHLDLKAHWKDAIRQALIKIRDRQIDKAFEQLEKIKTL